MPGETVALVGASGSGKTTVGRAIAGLVTPTQRRRAVPGPLVRRRDARRRATWRLACQMVFQDPYGSLDPRMTVGDAGGRAAAH